MRYTYRPKNPLTQIPALKLLRSGDVCDLPEAQAAGIIARVSGADGGPCLVAHPGEIAAAAFVAEQIAADAKRKASSDAEQPAPKKRGRPVGSKNKPAAEASDDAADGSQPDDTSDGPVDESAP